MPREEILISDGYPLVPVGFLPQTPNGEKPVKQGDVIVVLAPKVRVRFP